MSTEPTTPAEIERRIATARAHRAPVDSQGRPTKERSRFNYDTAGRLVDVTAPTDETD